MTIKVNNVAVNHLLSSEVKSFQFIRPQFTPENLFGRRHITTRFLGALAHSTSNLLTNDDIIYWHMHLPFHYREGDGSFLLFSSLQSQFPVDSSTAPRKTLASIPFSLNCLSKSN